MRPPFTVSSGLVVFLAILAVFSVNGRRNIPPRSPNRLAQSFDPFLYQARYSPIDWHPYGDEAFLAARRSGRPLLLYIGTPFSGLCRSIDEALEDESLAAYVTRNFVPVRIDGRIHPEWTTAIMPLEQLRVGALPEAQLWVLDPEGRVVHGILQSEESIGHDGEHILQNLIESLNSYLAGREHPTNPQSEDRAEMLADAPGGVPDFAAYAEALGKEIEQTDGRLLTVDQQEPLPSVVRFFTATGRRGDLEKFLDRILYSNLFDGLDGGVYRATKGDRLERNIFDKDTAQNAEFAAALARAANFTKRDDWRVLAETTFDWIADACFTGDGISPGRIGDEGLTGRSDRSSFPSYRIRDLLQGHELDFAQTDLGLDVSTNPWMAPYPTRSAAPIAAPWTDVRKKLLAGVAQPAEMVRLRLLNIEGTVSARLIEAAVALDSPKRLETAVSSVAKLDDYWEGGKLLARLGPDSSEEAPLHGYLAYADAHLQDYLATGNVLAFERGLAALQIARKRFATGVAGAFAASRPSSDMKLGVQEVGLPEICDAWSESTTARMIRLQHAYGRLLRPGRSGGDLETGAQQTMSHFSTLALAGGVRTAGYFVASGAMVDDDFALAIGPEAVSEALRLRRRCPMRLVAPAYGPVRPDVQGRKPGLYIVRGSRIEGPYPVETAATKLAPTLQLDLSQTR